MKKKGNEKHYRRLPVVDLRVDGKDNKESAKITKHHPKRVSQLVSTYCNRGIGALLHDGCKGGNNRKMSIRPVLEP